MVNKHAAEGFEAFRQKVEVLAKEDIPLFIYFSGSKSSDGNYFKYRRTTTYRYN